MTEIIFSLNANGYRINIDGISTIPAGIYHSNSPQHWFEKHFITREKANLFLQDFINDN